jgi:polyisoprenoid-binding protein YceI
MKITRSLFLVAAAALLSVPAFAAPTTWAIDPAHSSANFSIKHLGVSTVRGELGTTTGTVVYDAAAPEKSTIEATIDVKSISTHNEKRDQHLNSPELFDTAKFPTATFKSISVVKGAAGHFTVTGNLTMHGVTKSVVLDVEGPAAEQAHPMMKGTFVSGFTATTTIKKEDFGITYGGPMLGSDVKVELDIEVNRK